MRFGIIRIDRDGLLEMSGRFVMAAELLQRVADIVMGAGVARPQLQRFSIMRNRVVEASETGQRDGEMMLRVRRPLVGLDRAAKQPFRLGEAILLQPKDPQTINGIEMTVVASENLGIKLFGLA